MLRKITLAAASGLLGDGHYPYPASYRDRGSYPADNQGRPVHARVNRVRSDMR